MKGSVLKFGGSSLATIDKIEHVANIILKHSVNHEIVVVVSAMMGETDRLVSLGNQIFDNHHPEREMDQLISNGETITAALLALAIKKRGRDAVSLTGWQAGIHTTYHPQNATINSCDTTRIREALDRGQIPVVTGFQGVSNSDVTTLGRGGSDLTAIALSNALKAELCWIYTDVEGVYNVDPRMVPDAKLIPQMDFETLYKIALSGAKVVQFQAAAYAKKMEQAIRVCATHKPGAGTLINAQRVTTPPLIAYKRGIVLIQATKKGLEILEERQDQLGIFENLQNEKIVAFEMEETRVSNLIINERLDEEIIKTDSRWCVISIHYSISPFVEAMLKKELKTYFLISNDSIMFLFPEYLLQDQLIKINHLLDFKQIKDKEPVDCKP